MLNDNCKNLNTQLPVRVAAEIREFFDAFSYDSINGTLIEFVSAFTGPDPRSGKRHHIDICNTVDQIHKTIAFVRYCQKNFSKINKSFFNDQPKALDVLKFNYDEVEGWLFWGLSNWIYQDEVVTEPCLETTNSLTSAFLKLSDWLLSLEAINEKGGFPC